MVLYKCVRLGLLFVCTALSLASAPVSAEPTREEEPEGIYTYTFPSDARQIIVVTQRDYFRATNKKVTANSESSMLETMYVQLSRAGTTRNPGRRREVSFKANSTQRYWIILDCPWPARFEDFSEFDHIGYERSEAIFQCGEATDAR